MALKSKAAPFVENISESGLACLLTMVQGNILALGVSHWIIASQTGLIAGGVASVALLVAKTDKRWIVAVVLGGATTLVDYFVHPGMIGPGWLEPVITGLGAAGLSFLAGTLIGRLRRRSPEGTGPST